MPKLLYTTQELGAIHDDVNIVPVETHNMQSC